MNGREEAHTSRSGSDLTSIDSDDIELEALERLERASHAGSLRTTEYDTHEDGGQDEDGSAALLAYESGLRGARLIRERSHVGSIVVESAPTLLLTTVGLLFTGELLDHVSAAVVASVAACVSMALGSIVPDPPSTAPISFGDEITNSTTLLSERHDLPMNPGKPKSGVAEFIMVASSAMMSACLSSVLLGFFMCALIVACRRFGLDPDNIAPPVASCLGDLVTLLRRNSCVKDLVWHGWPPLFGAMVISSATGIVLDTFASRYQGFPLLAIVISGLPGSVGSIAISRLSTSLHAEKHHAQSRRREPSKKLVTTTLILITIPVEIIFLATLHAFGWLKLSVLFAVLSMLLFCCAVTISLLIANALTDFLWSKDLDPDMYALPIHSATMDLVGQLLLVLCFQLVSLADVNL
ncbi:hypothetical protein BKA83DRAFT_4320801 [Pisolithus microcarpus]|nr:hypothetical protein BKA83DRAFT_4320801 [Pisolithus microcarpus]